MKPLRIEANSLNKIIINHRITEKCNYKCPYCYFTGRNPINLEEDYDKIKTVFNNLEYVFEYYKNEGLKIDYFLTGGEPSLYPISVYEPLFQAVDAGKINKLTLSTNFSADPDWFIEFSKRCRDKTKFEIKAAFHPSDDTFEDYYDRITKVKDAPNNFVAHFTFDDNNFIGLEKLEKIKTLGVVLDVVLIHNKDSGKNCGKVNVTNEDLLSITTKSSGAESKNYTVFYDDKSSEKVTKNYVKKMDFSKNCPKCHHSDITIMKNKIGINCEYMRAMRKIDTINWFDLGNENCSKKELYTYLANDCVLKCDKQNCSIGNNCYPRLLVFEKRGVWQKLKELFNKGK